MEFGFYDLLKVIGALGLFMFGMKVMSEGIQKAAGGKLRKILSAMTKNPVLGVFTGFLITAFIQSSSATTVMTVSFVNAGIISLTNSAGVMMGANIGTTITAWLISFLGFKVSLSSIALPIIAFGFPMLFFKKHNLQSWGEMLIGFAILFLGLTALKNGVPDIKSNPEILEFLSNFNDLGYFSVILFVLVGTFLTVVVQSSSAAMAVTLIILANGWITFDLACAMVLGENVGTTITAELASMVGNVHAKRSARIHSTFNVIGVTWMLLVFPFFMDGISYLTTSLGYIDPLKPLDLEQINELSEDAYNQWKSSRSYALSAFHTTFNLCNVCLLVGFTPTLVKIAKHLVPSKTEEDKEFRLGFISTGLLQTPELSFVEAKKEVAKYGEIVSRMLGFTRQVLIEQEADKKKELFARIKKYEEITDRIEIEVVQYLGKVSEGEISSTLSKRIRSTLSIVSDLERIGDIFYQMSKTIERKSNDKIWFLPEQRNSLMQLFDLVDEAFTVMVKNLEADYEDVEDIEARALETKINKMRNHLRSEHLLNIEKGTYNVRSGLIYNDLFSSCERIGDHIVNVSEAIVGKI